MGKEKLIFSVFIPLLFLGCAGKEVDYATFSRGNFSVSYPAWEPQSPGENILAVRRGSCSVTVKEENFTYTPGAFRFRTKTIEMAFESAGLAVEQKESTDSSAVLQYSAERNTAEMKLVACDGKIYWVTAGCTEIFKKVLDSTSCSAPQVWPQEECPL